MSPLFNRLEHDLGLMGGRIDPDQALIFCEIYSNRLETCGRVSIFSAAEVLSLD